MAGQLGDLLITLRADVAQFQSDMGKATRIAERNAKQIAGVMRSAGTALRVFTAAAGGVTLLGVVKDAINLGDELGALKTKTGIAGTSLLELKYAAEQSDVSFQSLGDGLVKLRRVIGDATTGGKAASDAFRRVGISAADLQGQGVEQVFLKVADRLAAMTDENQRASAANDLLGRSYSDLLPLLNRGSTEIDKLRDQYKLMGTAISEDDIERLGRADEAIGNLKTSFQGLGLTVGGAVAGPLAAFSNWLAFGGGDPGDGLQNRIEDVAGEIRMLKRELDTNVDGRDGFTKRLKEAQARYAALMAQQQKMLGVGAGGAQPLPIPEVLVTAPRITAAMQAAEESARKFRAQLAAIREDMYSEIPEAAQRMQDAIDSALALDPYEVSQPMVDLEEFRRDAETMGQIFREESDDISVYADQAARNMQDAFADFLFDPFKGGLKGMLSGFVNTLRRMVAEAAAAEIFKSLFGGTGGLGGFLGGLFGGGGSKISKSSFGGGKALGGPVSGGMTYLVGERGPELFTPGTSGAITPNSKIGGGGGGITIAPVYNFNGTGVSAEQLLMIMSRNNQDLTRRWSDAQRRSGLPVPRF